MRYDLPLSVIVDNCEYKIRNKCDYRVVLDVFEVFNDEELSEQEKIKCSLYCFYQDIHDSINKEEDIGTALANLDITESSYVLIEKMLDIINLGKKDNFNEPEQTKLMDWEQDWNILAPAINDVLHIEIRNPGTYIHWHTLIGAYQQIKDCYWAQIVAIRNKLQKGKKLDESDREFYKECKNDIVLKKTLNKEEQEWLNSGW